MQSTAKKAALPAMTLAALGVVFGDIGTSPLYALKESFHAAHGLGIQPENVLGILSIIFWCLMLIISIKRNTYSYQVFVFISFHISNYCRLGLRKQIKKTEQTKQNNWLQYLVLIRKMLK